MSDTLERLDKHWKIKSTKIRLKLAECFLQGLQSIETPKSPRALADLMSAGSLFFKMTGKDLDNVNDLDGNSTDDIQSLVNRLTKATPDCTIDPPEDNQ